MEDTSMEDFAKERENEIDKEVSKVDKKIISALEKEVGQKFSEKEKDDALEDYSFWFDKYTNTKDNEFIKKEAKKIKEEKGIKESCFNY